MVESPAKARTLRAWLGREHKVIATYGHVLDLPQREESVRPGDDFAMVCAETGKRARATLRAIAAALAGAERLILATDPDREGEAIAWQVLSWLGEQDALGDRTVQRVVFHEVTAEAVREAMTRPRAIDMDLVRAQQARRALDFLVGCGLSPVLWRKLPGSRSAGRVQSVALRLVCAREAEIEAFEAREYWTVEADAEAGPGERFPARLVRIDDVRTDRGTFTGGGVARHAAARVRTARFRVDTLARHSTRRTPPPPFTTAALQQDAARRLGFAVRKTMAVAQVLYEGGRWRRCRLRPPRNRDKKLRPTALAIGRKEGVQ